LYHEIIHILKIKINCFKWKSRYCF